MQILQQYNYNPSKLIPILQAVQEEYQYLLEEVLTFIRFRWDCLRKVFGVATFYSPLP